MSRMDEPDFAPSFAKPVVWTEADRKRFESKFNKGTHCWEWSAGKYKSSGYGKFWVNGRDIGAHVFAFLLANSRSKPIVVRHQCDNPICVRPDHLLAGSAHDNVLDTRERNRIARATRHHIKRVPVKATDGEKNGRAVLSAEQVEKIRLRYRTEGRTSLRQLAREYGVSKSLIQRIVQGKVWSST